MDITTKQLHMLRHSLGLDENGHGRRYRNYYCTGPDCDSYQDCLALVRAGLMLAGAVQGDNHFYHVTLAGEGVALRDVVYPKFTRSQRRYRQFLALDSELTFKEFLVSKYYKEMRQ